MEHTDEQTVEAVKRFWEAHVNNEYYTRSERGTSAYFEDIASRRYRTHYHLRELFEELEGSRGRLLEVGCGIGMDSIELAKCGFDVTAVDLTDTAINVAKRYARIEGLEVDFRVGNAESLELPDDSFDAVYSFGVLHHTPDIEAAIEHVRRVLKPGGRAFVMLYHKRSLVHLIHQLFRLPYESPRNLKDHCPVVQTFTREGARRLFRRFGRVDVTCEYPFTYGMRWVAACVPRPIERLLGKAIGWHLMIRVQK
jgi:2-polyprenyl-3-methyl-5-hydroxy-6-metoxy-1,4-benzoquinol methylase